MAAAAQYRLSVLQPLVVEVRAVAQPGIVVGDQEIRRGIGRAVIVAERATQLPRDRDDRARARQVEREEAMKSTDEQRKKQKK